MEAHINLGRIFGVRVGLHYSWLFIALLVTLSLAVHFRTTNPDWGAGVIWAAAIVTGLLFFSAILAHELSHVAVAKARGLPVRSVILFALGGVAQIEKEAADPNTEFWMGIIGPITSALIGLLFLGLAWVFGWTSLKAAPQTPLPAMLMWLGYINVGLAAFNLIPGFPLDGGRVLRAAIWWATGDVRQATRVAARSGQGVAFGFMILGIFGFFWGLGFGGLWLVLIGWFLLDAARSSYMQMEIAEGLRGVRVGDVMTSDCPVVDSRTNLQRFIEEHLLRTGRRCFLVEADSRVAGLITPREVKGVEPARWPNMTVADVMRPLGQVRTVDPNTPVAEALEVMGREDLNQLLVMSDGRIAGAISRAHIMQLLQTRAELQA